MRKNETIALYCSLALCSAVSLGAAAGDDDDDFVLGQALIRLAQGSSIDDFNQQYNTSVLRGIASRNIWLLDLPDDVEDEEAWIAALRLNPPAGFLWGELNYEGEDGEGRTGSFYVSDINGQQSFNNQYTRGRIRLAQAHQMSTGSNTIVAVLDTGVDSTHPLLAPRVLDTGFNFVDNNTNTLDLADGIDNDGDGPIDESHGHGTFVAGLIAMTAPDASILPVKVLNSDGVGDSFNFAAGIYYAIDQGADVINLSLGTTYSADIFEDALEEAIRVGVIVVGAAGNRNVEEPREFPAMKSDVIGVVAVDENDIKTDFSNYNQRADLSAPGERIFSAIPLNNQNHNYAEWEGTSMSTPLVAGTAALLVSYHSQLTRTPARAAAIREAIEESAVDIDGLNQSFAGMLGAGRLDAASALMQPLTGSYVYDARIEVGTLVGEEFSHEDLHDAGDGDIVRIRSGFGHTLTDLHKMQLLVRAATVELQAPLLDVRVRSRSGVLTPGTAARIMLWNWDADRFETVFEYVVPGDRFLTAAVKSLPAAPYVNDEGLIDVQIRHVVVTPIFAFRFDSYFDMVKITAR